MTMPRPPEPPRKKKLNPPLAVACLIAAIIAGVGIGLRVHESAALGKKTKEAATPDVVVMAAPEGPTGEDIALPGNVQAWHEAPIYARTNGYLKEWVTDIGTPVKEGDLIAEIEAPEVDAQLRQAEADLDTAKANNDIAQITARRWGELLKTHAVSKQDADDRASAAEAAAAALASAEANLKRLQDLVSFERITAPFDGVITARNTDNGALINAGSSGTGPELFHIAETDKLRVYVQVPQPYAGAVTPDLAATLLFAEHPGKVFSAKLIHSADALDPVTRTLLIQLEADNDANELLPGGYAEVHLKVPSPNVTVRLPVNVLIFRAQGLQAAAVDDQNHARLKPITIGRDYGKSVEVTSGVTPGEKIIVNPPDSLADGQEVRIVKSKQNSDQNSSDDAGKPDPNKGDSKP